MRSPVSDENFISPSLPMDSAPNSASRNLKRKSATAQPHAPLPR